MPHLPESVVRRAFSSLARARGGARAVHPLGATVMGRVHRSGLEGEPVGVPWIDEAGDDRALVRMSRSVGLPRPLPDFFGLAVRIPSPGGPADLLLTSTGSAPVLRHVLLPALHPRRASYTSVVPFRTTAGRLMVGAFPADGPSAGFSLRVAGLRGGWRPFAVLTLDDPPEDAPDADTDTDPVLHPFEGLDMPAWLARPRAEAYDASRRARHRA